MAVSRLLLDLLLLLFVSRGEGALNCNTFEKESVVGAINSMFPSIMPSSCSSASFFSHKPPPLTLLLQISLPQAMGGGSAGILQAGTTEEKGSNARLVSSKKRE